MQEKKKKYIEKLEEKIMGQALDFRRKMNEMKPVKKTIYIF